MLLPEDETPAPVELYGRSKLAAEEELAKLNVAHPELQAITLRCPTIIDSGPAGFAGDSVRVYR